MIRTSAQHGQSIRWRHWILRGFLYPLGEMIRGTFFGLALVALIAWPLTEFLITAAIARFEQQAFDNLSTAKYVVSVDKNGHTLPSAAQDCPSVHIVHQQGGRSSLSQLPIDGVLPFSASERHLVKRLLVRKRDQILPSNAAPYESDLLIIELALERSDKVWHYVIDLAYQQAPGDWKRIAWWRKGGIAPTNELLRVEPDFYLPNILRRVTMPTTIESFTAYLSANALPTIKELNSDYKTHPRLNLSQKQFAAGVSDELARILPEDTGSIASGWPVFYLLTISGGLQLFMGYFAVICLMVLLARAIVLGVCEYRFLAWFTKSLKSHGGVTTQRLAAEHHRLINWLTGLSSPLLAGSAMLTSKDNNSKDVDSAKQKTLDILAENAYGAYYLQELKAAIVYLGLLGTLAYLVWALLCIRIDASSAKMQAILSMTSNTMSGAFLTTVASSTLHQIIQFLHAILNAFEWRNQKLAEQVLDESCLEASPPSPNFGKTMHLSYLRSHAGGPLTS